jgi:hypothetical protein
MIKRMLFGDKELYDRISDDYTAKAEFNPFNYSWLGWFEGKICKGLLQIHEENAIVLVIHINIMKKYRDNAFEIGNGLLRHLEKTCPERFVKINVKIPVIFPDVVRYAEKNGFVKEGTDRQSYKKNGKIIDRVMLGKFIEREDT